MSQEYIHGFTKTEEDRLYHQAVFLEPAVYENVSFPPSAHVLEVGSGVGAQTQILLRRFPDLQMSCVDASASQLTRAKQTLQQEISSGQVELFQANAEKLPFADKQFDGAFLCWILEHVTNPFAILKETRRCLVPGAPLFCTEVMNSTLFIWPQFEVIARVWDKLNTSQISIGGDPYIGAKLPNLFLQAGYHDIQVKHINYQFDGRNPQQRVDFFRYWEGIMLSAIPGLVKNGELKADDEQELRSCFNTLVKTEDAVFSYCAFQVRAQA